MRRPNKPHRDGYEDEEDCEGYYDPDEADRRGCHPSWARQHSDLREECQRCIKKWRTEEDAKRKAEWDAKTPEEKAQLEAMIKGLRELY